MKIYTSQSELYDMYVRSMNQNIIKNNFTQFPTSLLFTGVDLHWPCVTDNSGISTSWLTALVKLMTTSVLSSRSSLFTLPYSISYGRSDAGHNQKRHISTKSVIGYGARGAENDHPPLTWLIIIIVVIICLYYDN